MKYIYAAAVMTILAASCKEQPVQINKGSTATDTTYVTTPETPQQKLYLLEELSGVQCSNCPEGAIYLEELNEQNDERFVIVALHTGSLTNPIPGKSLQSFQSPDAQQIRQLVFGEEGNKPTVSFDRYKLGNGNNTYLVDGAPNWPQAIAQMKANASTTPVNVEVTSSYNADADKYDIVTKVSFTEELTAPVALSIYVMENDIKEAFVHADTFITYNHVFRKAVTAPTGNVILSDIDTKESGRVFVYHSELKIDPTDESQKFWVPENMQVVAFVSHASPDDKHVYQVAVTDLQ